MIFDNDYCEKSDSYKLMYSDEILNQMNVFTEFSSKIVKNYYELSCFFFLLKNYNNNKKSTNF